MIEYKGHSFKNSISEFTIKEFEEISAILNDEELEQVEKYMEVFEKLGIPTQVVDEMSDDDFFYLIRQFDLKSSMALSPAVEIEGHLYVAHDGEFKMRVKDLSLIEKAVAKNPNKCLARVMAVIFKREDLSRVEHYTEAHLKHKEKLFEKQPAVLAYPYLVHVIENLNKKFKHATTEELERS